ncbi:hypothetical protein JCM11251_003048 [Rhodosporidiobolus azoricus]
MLFDTPLLNTNATPVSSAPAPTGRPQQSSSSKRKRSHSSSATISNSIPLGDRPGAGGAAAAPPPNVEINVEKLLKKMKQSEAGAKGAGGAGGGGGGERQAKKQKKEGGKQGKPAQQQHQQREQQPRQQDRGGKQGGNNNKNKKSRQQRSSSPPPPTPDRRAAFLPRLPTPAEEEDVPEVKPVVLTPGMTLHKFAAPSQAAAASSSSSGPATIQGAGKKGSVQDKLRAQLAGGKFRMLNEQLYTTSGAEAYRLMKDEGAFDDYHIGFRSQAATWPVHPLSLIARSLLDTLEPNSLIADFGCGDAALARSLCPPPSAATTAPLPPIPSLKLPAKLVAQKKLKVASFDLVSQNSFVVEAECSSVPLPGGVNGGEVVDAVVCCLSLMGTDWLEIVREARRVMRVGGVLKIAEVTSRFPSIDDFIKLLTSLGFSLSHKDDSNTHFLLLDFTKTADGEAAGKVVENTRKSEKLLNPCIYKRR